MEKKTAFDRAKEYYDKFVKGNESDENVTYKKFYGDDGDRYIMIGTDGTWEFASGTSVKKMWRFIFKEIYEPIANEAKEKNND